MLEEVRNWVIVMGCEAVGSGNRVAVFLMEFADVGFLTGMKKKTVNGILEDLSEYQYLTHFSSNRPWHRKVRGNFQHASEMQNVDVKQFKCSLKGHTQANIEQSESDDSIPLWSVFLSSSYSHTSSPGWKRCSSLDLDAHCQTRQNGIEEQEQ